MEGKRRWIELGKDALIALLALSAAGLLTMTPLVRDSGLWGASPEAPAAGREDEAPLTAAAYPSRLALTGPGGRYGVQYQQEEVDALFAQVGPLLGEALASAGQPQRIQEADWRGLLQGEGVYFDFSGYIPLSALAGWLRQGADCPLEGSARRIALARGEDDGVLLCYQEQDGGFYACATQLSARLHLAPATAQAEGNGALFAFEWGEAAGLLDPYTLITEGGESRVYAASTPVTAGSDLTGLLDTLSFNATNHTAISGGEVYLAGGDRREGRHNGTVIFRAGQPGRYPAARRGERATLAEGIELARQLAEGTVGAWCGQARLHLSRVEETAEGWLIQFSYQLEGAGVWLYQDGWAAQFLIQDDCVTQFTLRFRSYTDTGEQALLLPVDRAAALLPGLEGAGGELVIQYRDQGEGTVEPMWVVR